DLPIKAPLRQQNSLVRPGTKHVPCRESPLYRIAKDNDELHLWTVVPDPARNPRIVQILGCCFIRYSFQAAAKLLREMPMIPTLASAVIDVLVEELDFLSHWLPQAGMLN